MKQLQLKYYKLLSQVLMVIGVLVAIAGLVRSGSIIIAVGLIGITFTRFIYSEKKRRIELVIPLGLAAMLIVVALTIPHAK